MKMKVIVLIFISAIMVVSGYFWLQKNQLPTTNSNLEIFRPKEISDVIKNPSIGYQTFSVSAKEDTQLPSSVMYARFDWVQVESSPGVYDFSVIDAAIAKAKAAGQKLAFRIAPFGHVIPYKGPEGLKKAGFPGFDVVFQQTQVSEKMPLWIPNMDSPLVQADLGKLIAAIGARYGNNPDVDHVDVGFFGDWGEFHYGFLRPEVFAPKTSTFKWFFDMYKTSSFKVPLIVNENLYITGFNNEIAWDYAMQKGIGWRGDCWGDWGDMQGAKEGEAEEKGRVVGYNRMTEKYNKIVQHSPNAWKTAPVVMEPCGTMKFWGKDSWKKTLQWTIDNHISQFSNKSDSIPAYMLTAVQDTLTKIGYRFVLTQAQYPSQVSAGQNFNLTLNWTNKGNAPMYFDRNLVVKIGSKVIDTGKSFKGFLPGSRTDNVSINTTGITPGTYPLEIGLAEPGKSPDITLAIEGSGPWYMLGNIEVR